MYLAFRIVFALTQSLFNAIGSLKKKFTSFGFSLYFLIYVFKITMYSYLFVPGYYI